MTSKEYYQNHKEERKKYYQDHKEEKKKYSRNYHQEHKKEKKEYDQNYRKNHKEKIKKNQKNYRLTHRGVRRNYVNNRLKIDINFKLARNLRTRTNKAIRNNQKSGSAVKDLGCTISELKLYLESKFQEGMTWDNWNRTGWHIDHIIPLDSFELTNREEFLKANHYTNLQPLWANDNLTKSSTK